MDTLSQLSRDICALGNQTKAWNQRLDKFRNRMNRLEDTINNLPGQDAQEQIQDTCANANSAEDGADALLACEAVLLPLSPLKGTMRKMNLKSWLAVENGSAGSEA